MKVWWLALLAGCPVVSIDTDVDSDSSPDSEVDTDTAACPALVATAEPAALNPFQRGIIRVSGGSGSVAFSLLNSETGALVSEVTGEYLAGGLAGMDTIRATDACGMTSDVTVTVIPSLVVLPSVVQMPLEQTVVFDVHGGSAEVFCAVSLNRSGGSLAGCSWTTGTETGTDVIVVSDPLTDDAVEVDVQVRQMVRLSGPEIAITPLGTTVPLEITGGSGHYNWVSTTGDAGLIVDGLLLGDTAGQGTYSVVDRYVPNVSMEVRAWVAAPQGPIPLTDAIYDSRQRALSADLDGDGFTDAIVGLPNANAVQSRGGLVLVYRGVAGGLDPVPAQVFEGETRTGNLGWDLEFGDIDGDGELDLIIGEYAHYPSVGRVRVHRGLGDGTFTQESWDERIGEFGGDRLGTSVATCDINGDGIDDVVASARSRDNRVPSPIIRDVGVIHAWLGGPDGLSEEPVWSVFGHALTESGFVSATQFLGRNVDVGDFDGDGRCDVAAATETSDEVHVYLSSDVATGLPETPSRVYRGDPDTEDLGWALHVADVDDDGLDDILIGGWRTDAFGLNRAGAVHVFRMADDDGRPATSPVFGSEASVILAGSEASEEFGVIVGAVDLNGDGRPEIWGGGTRTDDPTVANNSGGIQWWDGVLVGEAEYGTLFSEEDNLGALYGPIPDGGFGLAAAPLHHTAGSWVVTEGRSSEMGPRVGDVYVAHADGTWESLLFPIYEGGALIGRDGTMALVDFGGDASTFVVAAPLGGAWPNHADAGQLYTMDALGQTSWFEVTDTEGPIMPDYRGGLHVGYRMNVVGDIDGDGSDDLAVVARLQRNRPDLAGFVSNPDECRTGQSGTGAVAIYRGGEAAGRPDYLVYGPTTNSRISRVVGGDLNGDGYGDIVMSHLNTNADSIGVAFGRPLQDQTVVLCDTTEFAAVGNGDVLGDDMAALGDIDGDGCDDVAIGAPSSDPGGSNRGSVYILFGWGEACATETPRQAGFASTLNNDRIGVALVAADVDGDGEMDLLIGGPDSGPGRVYRLDLSRVAAFAEPLGNTFVEASNLLDEYVLIGSTNGSDFGRALAVVQTAGNPYIVVGEPFHDILGDDGTLLERDVGRGHLYRWESGAFVRKGFIGPDLSVPAGLQGAEMTHGLVGYGTELLIGAPRSHATTRDNGTVYRIDLSDD